MGPDLMTRAQALILVVGLSTIALLGFLAVAVGLLTSEGDSVREAREIHCDSITYGRVAFEDCMWEAGYR